jgi:hypothetical protein
MKNIFLLPTDKPSRLTIRLKTDELMFSYKEFVNQESDGVKLNKNQHIYITNDEEIKEGDWRYDSNFNKITKGIGESITYIKNHCKKIILTTDQDLIKDGIQSIDDEFLEWFVKNPNCENVEIEPLNIGNGKLGYIICKSQEEPEQLSSDHSVYMDDDMYLPIRYKGIKVKQPFYSGEGNHSVRELESICKQFTEYVHQQQVIKQNCMKHIIELKFGK